MSLAHHLHEAIALNRERRAYYARHTGGASRKLSNVLIATEYAALPVGWLIDRWAAPFNRKGIPIVQDDFVSMTLVPPADRPPESGLITDTAHKKGQSIIRLAQRDVLSDVDLSSIAVSCAAALRLLSDVEQSHTCQFAMTLHLLESAGYVATNGVSYAKETGGKTIQLSKTAACSHLLLLQTGLLLDRWASHFHERGIGIIANDIPEIPFS